MSGIRTSHLNRQVTIEGKKLPMVYAVPATMVKHQTNKLSDNLQLEDEHLQISMNQQGQ